MRFEWNDHSVYVPEWVHEVASILLAETVNDNDTVNREWLIEEWLRRHPEGDAPRIAGPRKRNMGLMGTHEITIALKALAQTGLIARLGTHIEIVDRVALAAFAEAVRSSF